MNQLIAPPYITKMEYNETIDSMESDGSFPLIFRHLQDVMNFTFKLSMPEDRQYGIPNPDGESWTGMVGNLQKKAIDIGMKITENY